MTPTQQEALDALREYGSLKKAAAALGIHKSSLQERLKRARHHEEKPDKLTDAYDLDRPDKTPAEAWAGHADAFERAASKTFKNRWPVITRPRGAFVVFHSTDEHLDDDKTPLRLIEADIKAAHGMNAVMCHGGDALNNWPMAGKLAAQWAQQQCTAPDALLRLKHFIQLFRPEVWTDGNHEEMNPYLDHLIGEILPAGVIRDYWTVRFRVETPSGKPVKISMSHKFQKGSSWFHPHQGFIREMLEGEEADLYLEGHLHISGSMHRTLPERGISAVGVASAGYKILDRYAARISRGGVIPKIKGRAHWIVCDPFCDDDGRIVTPFDCPQQAEAYLNGLNNIREV